MPQCKGGIVSGEVRGNPFPHLSCPQGGTKRAMKVKLTQRESSIVVPETGEGKMGSYCLMHTGFQIGWMKKFWRQMVVMVAQQHECT